MSVINKMLQDLDRRNAMAGGDGQPGVQNVKPVEPGRGEPDVWFWRVVATLLFIAVAWVGWVAWQLQPRPLFNDQAIRAAAAAQPRPAPVAPVVVAPPPVVVEAKPVPVAVEETKTAPPPPSEPAETFKLARSIETPIAERKAPPAPAPAKPKATPQKAVQATVTRQEPTRSSGEAEAQFRRAALFLNQGRVSEAEAHLALALKADPAHTAARQAYVALLLEQQRVAEARVLLEEAVARNPMHAPFALALARIEVGQRDYAAALQTLDRAGAAGHSAEFHGLHAVVLQRMGRHAEAVEAYQQALRSGPQQATTWIGLGISLEALGHRAEAAQAYQRALGAGALAAEVKDYAQGRIRALQ